MAKRTIKINIKLPTGVTATDELVKEATKAAKAVVDSLSGELAQAQKMARELAKQGFTVSADELLKSKSGKSGKGGKGPKAAVKTPRKKSARTRVVLSDAQKAALADDLKKGMKINQAAGKYGVSPATVMNIKTAAGLTRKNKG